MSTSTLQQKDWSQLKRSALSAEHVRAQLTADSAHALSATTLTMAFGLLLMGPLADRIGRVQLMRWSLLTSASGTEKILLAVARWTSRPSRNACFRFGSSAVWASTTSSICE